MNRDLKPQYSTTYEAGAKGLALSRVQYDAAVFDTEVRDELIPFEIPGGNGRTYYRNAGRTRRRGAELQLGTDVGAVSLNTAYSLSHFRFRDFKSGTSQFGGNSIPGIPEQQVQASATWRFKNAYALAEGVAKSKVFVNDANGAAAPGLRRLQRACWRSSGVRTSVVVARGRVQNLFDKHYVGSVAVNAAGATIAATKFYEPAPGRTWYVGLSAATSPW